jgi:ribosomal RNA-processing protein 36
MTVHGRNPEFADRLLLSKHDTLTSSTVVTNHWSRSGVSKASPSLREQCSILTLSAIVSGQTILVSLLFYNLACLRSRRDTRIHGSTTRQPRPARRPNQLGMPHVRQSKAQLAKQARPKAIRFLSESENATKARLQKAHDDESDDDDTSAESDKDEEDIDAPRVAQWMDDEDLEQQTDDDEDSEGTNDNNHSASEVGPSRTLVCTSCVIRLHPSTDSYTVRRSDLSKMVSMSAIVYCMGKLMVLLIMIIDLSTLPLGTLRSAQRSLTQAQALSDTESDSEEQSEGSFSASEDDDPFPHPTNGKYEEKPDQPPKPKNGLVKRTNKHA